ncbi:alpha/beta hydrolase [Sphingomonas sp. C8-2]|jgi:pimeloyl-ACP methyl ester carboxylesterase|nr:alpha/beta hydrolase [Sphingomonas sp. C8-2]
MTSVEQEFSDTPDWFDWAMAQPHERGRLSVEGAGIEWLAWGDRGRPGILMVTGNGAHMGWWRPIAPFLANDRRVTAMSWSGMGGSDWRDAYSPELFVREAQAVAEETGLFDGPVAPVMVGHSFGGILTALTAATAGHRMRAAVLIDARLSTRSVWGAEAEPVPPRRIHASCEQAIARFRLQPSQPMRNRYLLDMIAAEALERAGEGWRWSADPEIRHKTELGSNLSGLIPRAGCPLMFIRGALSTTVSDEIWAEHQALAPSGTPFVIIPDAHHHVMIDQPIALIAVLRALLATLA